MIMLKRINFPHVKRKLSSSQIDRLKKSAAKRAEEAKQDGKQVITDAAKAMTELEMHTLHRKIPHTGDKASLDRCG